jgi:hypothetical protein
MKWSLNGPLPKMCLAVRPFNQDGPHSQLSHLGQRAEPPETFLEENHSMTISSKFSSY